MSSISPQTEILFVGANEARIQKTNSVRTSREVAVTFTSPHSLSQAALFGIPSQRQTGQGSGQDFTPPRYPDDLLDMHKCQKGSTFRFQLSCNNEL